MPVLTGFRVGLTSVASALALSLAPVPPVAAQPSDTPAAPSAAAPTPAPAPPPTPAPAPPPAPTPPPTPTPTPPPAPAPAPALEVEAKPRINLLVTVPRAEVNEAQAQQCRNEADAGTISGEIVVCAQSGKVGANALTGSRKETQKRYAQETAFKGAPRTPEAFGIPSLGNSIGLGKAPAAALIIDVEALPKAPAGSDADRIARGLAPTGKEEALSEEQERARREAAGIKTSVPPRPKKKRG